MPTHTIKMVFMYLLLGVLVSSCAWIDGMWRFISDPCCTEENRLDE